MDSKRNRLLFGLEVELGFAVCDEHGERMDPDASLWRFLKQCAERIVHLPGQMGSRMYLANGSLIYPDVGHPEFATAECSSPLALLQALRAGERLLTETAAALASSGDDVGSVALYRTNVDYAALETTWGCHESYLSRRLPESFARKVVPHLASRIIYTGCGGFDNRSHSAMFALSPRAFHLSQAIASEGGRTRAIFSLRDDPLSERYHRVHLVCGEPNCAEVATYLKVGATALVLAMVDAGIDLGIDDQWINVPVAAMSQFSFDPECVKAVGCSDDSRRTAIEIQRHYLERVEDHCDAAFMPPWAEAVCRRWRGVLDQLERDPLALVGVLDWPTKHALFKHHTRCHSSLSFSSLPIWSSVAKRVSKGFDRPEGRTERVDGDEIKACSGGIGERSRLVRNLTAMLDEHGLDWDDLEAFHTLRDELCELDMRYGQLYPQGIFMALEDAGEIREQIVTPEQIDAAIERAPEQGRARVRGDWVRRLADRRDDYACDWTRITSKSDYLDLADPFVTEARWIPREPRRSRAPSP